MSSDFLISFHQKHFADTEIPIYSKQVFYKLIEEINKIKEKKLEGSDNFETSHSI